MELTEVEVLRANDESSGLSVWGHNECVAMAMGEKEKLTGTVFITLRQGKIRRIDLCGSPHPSETLRSGEYPS